MKMLGQIKKNIKINDLWYVGILAALLIVLFCFGHGLENNYREIIICVVVVISLLALLIAKMWLCMEFYKFSFVFIVIVGLLSLMIQPILNIPDEVAHFSRAEWLSRGNLIADSTKTEYKSIQSVVDLNENVKKTYISSTIKGNKIDYSPAYVGHIAASNASFLYFPQAIGVIIAKLLQLDVIWMLWLARLGNLLCYALGICAAIKITPRLKFPLFFVATFPICIQQAASCSTDAIVNGAGIFLIAYFLSLYCMEDNNITWKQTVFFWVIVIIVTISKVTNIFMAGLFLLIPNKKFASLKKAVLTKLFIIASVIIIGGLYYLHTTSFPASAEHLLYFQQSNVNSKEQIMYIFLNFTTWIRQFGTALIENFVSYVNTLGSFGWLEYGNSLISLITVFMLGKICAQEAGIYMNRINKLLLSLIVIGIYIATCFAMYISWTPVGSNEILGVQGRYFIPAFAMLTPLLATPGNCMVTEKNKKNDMIVILGLNGAMLIASALRYY